jgi:hypothetical protein
MIRDMPAPNIEDNHFINDTDLARAPIIAAFCPYL